MLVDTHAHLDFPEFADDFDAILHRAKEAGVGRIVTIGTTLKSSRKAIEFAEHHREIYAVVGIHPNSVTEERGDFLPELQELAGHPQSGRDRRNRIWTIIICRANADKERSVKQRSAPLRPRASSWRSAMRPKRRHKQSLLSNI